MVLLDNGAGTGARFDWDLVRGFPRPFILAGGLTPENIPAALALGPYAVDLSSGVEVGGVKDGERIRAAVAAARGAKMVFIMKPGTSESGIRAFAATFEAQGFPPSSEWARSIPPSASSGTPRAWTWIAWWS
jgi:hypothetical protein